MDFEFDIGDRVRLSNLSAHPSLESWISEGATGTVVSLPEIPYLGVDWDDYCNGHICAGSAREGHGLWVHKDALTLVSDRITVPPPTDNEVFEFLTTGTRR